MVQFGTVRNGTVWFGAGRIRFGTGKEKYGTVGYATGTVRYDDKFGGRTVINIILMLVLFKLKAREYLYRLYVIKIA